MLRFAPLRGPWVLFALAALSIGDTAWAQYGQTNLVSDLSGVAAVTDPNLQNPWGIASSLTSPFWVANNQTGVASLYNSTGVIQGLVVTVSPPIGGAPPAA